MAELVVRGQGKSKIRLAAEAGLNITFPLWGVISPIGAALFLLYAFGSFQSGRMQDTTPGLVVAGLLLTIFISATLAKRFLTHDKMLIDRDGIRLPYLLGTNIHVITYIKWTEIVQITAMIPAGNFARSSIIIERKKGKPVAIATASLTPDFVEQFVLAANMWAPSVCDHSLKSLQEILQIEGDKHGGSHTSLWEKELKHRFCPAAYITLEPGKMLRNNSLRVVSHLATGGLSSLYLCQLDNQKLVVLKEAAIPEGSIESVREKAAELFQREAMLLMKLNHPNIVKVLDCFIEQGRNYMLMEYVNGIDLRQLVDQNGAQNEATVIEWAISIAGTLKHLHEREKPIVHRDLTPDNLVLRNDGHLMVVDFGAANEFISTATGTFVGKHAFIAPEQLRGKATVQSDIYAFGGTLYFLLTGHEPEALCPSDPRDHNPNISEDLATFILQCTQLETADRYQSAAQLIPVLKGLAAQSVVI